MAKFCTQCGASVNEHARFCNKCGAKLAPTQPAPSQSAGNPTVAYQQAPPRDPNYPQDPYRQPYQAPYPQPGAPGAPVANAEIKPNVAGLLCYPLFFISGILFLVWTPYNKDSFVRFHAYQSIFFTGALLALRIALEFFALLNPIGLLDGLLLLAFRLLALGGTGWLMYQAYQGQKYKLPVIGDLAESQAAKP